MFFTDYKQKMKKRATTIYLIQSYRAILNDQIPHSPFKLGATNQMTGLYMKRNTGLSTAPISVKSTLANISELLCAESLLFIRKNFLK